MATTNLQLRSLVTETGKLELSLVDEPRPVPGEGEVVVRIDAAPLNPSDIGLLFGAADLSTVARSGSASRPVVTATIPDAARKAMAARVGQSMPVGNEGAGVVVEAGAGSEAQALLGKNVAVLGGAMYSQFRRVKVADCLVLHGDTTPREGSSAFVNPMTALGMVETMKSEGHTALVHTAGASSLGQMLNRLCMKDGIALVSVVRRPEQADLLRAQGAEHVCDTSASTFTRDLAAAVAATKATLAFDATGGGQLASQILVAMEAMLSSQAKGYSRYGSPIHKQVYIYGALDPSPLELGKGLGMAWGVGGWLVMPFMQKIGADGVAKLKARIASEIRTTFATTYSNEVSLAEALGLDAIADYSKRGTGGKYVINPNRGLA